MADLSNTKKSMQTAENAFFNLDPAALAVINH